MNTLIAPYGGEMQSLLRDCSRAENLKREAQAYASLTLSWQQLCELELLLTGALSPLQGYMDRADMEGVLSRLRMADGLFWPRPVVLAIDEQAVRGIEPGTRLALRDAEGFLCAILNVTERWQADPEREIALAQESGFPLSEALSRAGQIYLAGRLDGVALPPHHDFLALRLNPAETRTLFSKRGWRRVMGMMPSQPLHRMHLDFFKQIPRQQGVNLMIQVAGGADPVHDASHFSRVRACQAIQPRFPATVAPLFSLSPLPSLREGDREVLYKAIIARNHGCSHLVVGGEWIPSGEQRRGVDMAAEGSPLHTLTRERLGVELIPFPRLVYAEERDAFVPEEEVADTHALRRMSGAELYRRLVRGEDVPEWYTFPEVIDELSKAYPPRSGQGFTVFFTGLSGAGKSTLARGLAIKLMELGGRRVTLLDGDVVRRHLSSELGFSRAHRDINIRRIGYVASEITKHGGVAICAPIAPYQFTRRDVRAMVSPWGGFIEVYVATSLEVCEGRDRKGLYAKARAGLLPEFTGVSDPYEVPEQAELVIDTAQCGVEEAMAQILAKLEDEGYLA